MSAARRGGPARFDERLQRCEALLSGSIPSSAVEPLTALAVVLAHQQRRVVDATVRAAATTLVETARARAAAGIFPMFDVGAALVAVDAEVARAVDAFALGPIPRRLAEEGVKFAGWPTGQRLLAIEEWLDDPDAVEARHGFWIRAAATPIIEVAASTLDVPIPDDWRGAACPLCGGAPQLSVITEEPGEFMGGSPRTLVCSRCASTWPYPRITCAVCGEEDHRHLDAFVADDDHVARVDICRRCHGYIKTFDLGAPGGGNVVPLVDDVATMWLDRWAGEHGFTRPSMSFAGLWRPVATARAAACCPSAAVR